MRPNTFRFLIFLTMSQSPTFAAIDGVKTLETREIKYRGGLVTFSIPKHWVEEYEPEDGGTFYEDGPNTGTLRVNVITMKSVTPVTANSGLAALSGLGDVKPLEIKNLPNGNAVTKFVRHSTDQGQAITLYWWYVAQSVPPQHLRTAMFSYTIPSSSENSPNSVFELKFLDEAIQNATFHPTLGE